MRSHAFFRAFLAAVTLFLATLVNAANLARVGPAEVPAPPGNGFPKWYQDLNGLVLDLCLPDASDPGALQLTACLLGPPNPPFTFPDTFPDEAFFYRAVSDPIPMPDASGVANKRAILVLALEAAFGNGVPAVNDQMVFTRIRVIAGVPFDGTYTVTHPYGTETFTDVVASPSGNRDIAFTEDVGLTVGVFTDALTSRVGPFLRRADASGNFAGYVTLNGRQFLSDGVATETVTGSPFGTNYFEICGPFDNPDHLPTCQRTDLFSLTGKLHDSAADPIGSPLSILRATFSRNGPDASVDVAANAVQGLNPDGSGLQAPPVLHLGASNVPPVRMEGPDALGNFFGQGLPTDLTFDEVTVTNSADNPPTSVKAKVFDAVTVLSATYDYLGPTLVVEATSSDKGDGTVGSTPVLELAGFVVPAADIGTTISDPAYRRFQINGLANPPISVTVSSSRGGQGRLNVTNNGLGARRFSDTRSSIPFAADDHALADAQIPGQLPVPVTINVLANDLQYTAGPVTIVQGLTPVLGAIAANADGSVTYTPSTSSGDTEFRYTISNAQGTSNVAKVRITVNAPAGTAPFPVANADPNAGETITVNPNTSRVIDVLANDSGNGGTLDPATVTIASGPTGGSATVNPGGTVTYTAPATPGTYTFTYTVANTNGNQSAPATVTVTVPSPEQVTVDRARCTRASIDWDVRGTSTVLTGNSVTVYNTATVTPTSQVIGTAPVDALGAWALRVRGGLGCVNTISVQSALGTKRENIAVQVK